MATDRSLATLLRALHSPSSDQDASRLLGSASTLLTLLSNPLNVTLLTAQILSAPAIWHNPSGLRTPFRILGIFNTASIRILEQETPPSVQGSHLAREGLAKEDWVKAVVKGADDRSPRWRHLLVLGGLMLGFEGQGRQGLSSALRRTLKSAVVKAANLALEEVEPIDELGCNSIAVVLSHVFELLGDFESSQIDHNLLLPILVRAPYFSKSGLYWGYFLGTMDSDIVQNTSVQFTWSMKSSTYYQVQQMASGPLIASLGSLSRFAAFCVQNVNNVNLLLVMTEDISAFCRSLCIQWRQNKLSEIDIAEELEFLSDETLKTSLPLLWQVLKSTMFATVIILRALLGRVLGEGNMPRKEDPFIAVQTLHILRNLYFISSRLGHDSFSQYTFVYLTAIDILSKYPVQAEAFLRDIKPAQSGRIPQHPLDRCHDLFFLNTVEHFTTLLHPATSEEILVNAATPYLSTGSDSRLLEIFEAAHSVMLAVLAAPQCLELVPKYLPFYVDALFQVFPQNLSSRQFRMAVKTLVRITTPPSLVSERQPLLASTLLELVLDRTSHASNTRSSSAPIVPISLPLNQALDSVEPILTEQATMVMALIDCLPFLPIDLLEEWLPLAADSVKVVHGQEMLNICQKRFWEVLSNGEMDVARGAVCVAWWNTRGGRETVLCGGREEERGPFMSGGLGEISKL